MGTLQTKYAKWVIKYMERCSTSLVFREMQIKTNWVCSYIIPRTPKMMKRKNTFAMSSIDKVGDSWNSYTLFVMVNGYNYLGKPSAFSD